MKKIVFIDVDGTLTMQNGAVPQSAFEGIQKMRQKGIEVYLCTGRSMSEITSDIQEIGFDGYIAAGGGYIEKKGEVIYHRLMPQKSVEEMMRYFDTHQVGYYLESNLGLFPNEFCIPNIKRSVDRLVETSPHLFVDINNPYPNWFIDILKKSENKNVELDKINKLSFVSLDHPFEETFKQFSNQFEIYQSTVFEFGKESGEIGLKNIDKQFAIEMLLNTYSEKIYTYAYGDGLNDLAMFASVDVGIAMRNGAEALKEVAHEVIGIAEEDALYHSFIKQGFI